MTARRDIDSRGAPLDDSAFLQRAARSVVSNAVMLPIVAILNLAISVVIRRYFLLDSGVYDVLIGFVSTVVFFTAMGLPTATAKFLPELRYVKGMDAVRGFLRRIFALRVALAVVALVPINLWAEQIAGRLPLGPEGATLIHIVSGIILTRAVIELVLRTLQALFDQVWSNLLAALQSLLDAALVASAITIGLGMGGVFAALAASGAVLVLTTYAVMHWRLHRAAAVAAPPEPDAAGATRSRIARFTAFSYGYDIFEYLTGPAYAKLGLGAVLQDTGQVALFSTGLYVAYQVIVLMVSPFRGLYVPLLSHVRARGEPKQLERAFTTISKVQLLLLIPTGIGLGIMVGDYIPLLYTDEFLPAVAVTRTLAVFMFAETAFNLGPMLLHVGERYGRLVRAQTVVAIGAPLFLVTAATWGIVAGAAVLGASRLLFRVVAYREAKKVYGVRFPWSFAAKVAIPGAAMAIVLVAARSVWPTSPLEATVLTLVGAAVFLVGLRFSGAVGPDEFDLIARARIPGHTRLIRWLDTGMAGRASDDGRSDPTEPGETGSR